MVSGKSRVAVPPASTMPFMAPKGSSRRDGPARCDQRGLALGRGVPGMHGCSPSGSVAAAVRVGAVDRLFLERRQATLVVEDHQDELELLEIRRGLQVGGLDDGVRVSPDVDDLADEQALRVGRPDTAAQLDPGADDLIAERRFRRSSRSAP